MGISKQNVDQDGVYKTPKKMENLDHNPKQLPPATYDVGFNYVALQGLINLINSNSEMFFYNGSLTTAPCNEDVMWMIFGEPRTISKFQFDYLKKFMVMSSDTKKAMMTNKCTSIAGHFDGHADALKRYEVHRLMQHDQGYTGSLCMLPSGDYSLHIAPVAARATITKQCKNAPSLLAISMDIAMRRYYTACIAQWRRSMTS